MTTTLETDAHLEELMERANVNFLQRSEFRADPARAILELERALRRKSVVKPAAYALTRFRAVTAHAPGAEEIEEPLTLSELRNGLESAERLGAPAAIIASIRAQLELAEAERVRALG